MKPRLKIFVLLPRVPWPLEKGDKLRAYHQIRILSESHDIHLCCLNDTPLHPDALKVLGSFCKTIHIIQLTKFNILINLVKALFTGKPLQVGYFFSSSAHRIIKKQIAEINPDHIYCQLLRTAEYVRNEAYAKTIDYQDIFSTGIKRRISGAPFWNKWWLKIECLRLTKYENSTFEDFDNKTIISYPDRELFPHPDKEKIFVIPNGVDFEYFKPFDKEREYDLIFTGNMNYPPNIASAEYLVKTIMPLVHRDRPAVTLLIAGTNPHKKVRNLGSDKVSVAGWVRDMRACYSGSRIFIAPMVIGTGLQNKILEAMAMKLPCITSPLANNALGAIAGEEILVGNSPEDYRQYIIGLIDDQAKANELATRGYSFVIEHFNWPKITAKLEDIIVNTKRIPI